MDVIIQGKALAVLICISADVVGDLTVHKVVSVVVLDYSMPARQTSRQWTGLKSRVQVIQYYSSQDSNAPRYLEDFESQARQITISHEKAVR